MLDLIRAIPGDDRPDYWLGEVRTRIRRVVENQTKEVTHLIVASRWEGTEISPGVENLPVNIAYVTDSSVLHDEHLDFAKSAYVAIGRASDTGGGLKPKPLNGILAGTIAPAFQTGKLT